LSPDASIEESERFDELKIWPVDLPRGCLWKRLDRHGPWKEFVDGSIGKNGNLDYSQHIREFDPTKVIAVDWHGMLVWAEICARLESMVNVYHYNFRVYSSSLWSHAASEDVAENEVTEVSDEQFYLDKEQFSCRVANAIICLSDCDRSNLQCLMKQDGLMSSEECNKKMDIIQILPPPLRGDILDLAGRDSDDLVHHLPEEVKAVFSQAAQQMSNPRQHRIFITCVVRLSPEKSPHHFISFIQKLGGVEFLRNANLVPLIIGAKSVESYAQSVFNDLNSMCRSNGGWPCVTIDRFLGPIEMAAVFSHTAINIHPCLYDAYGMTVVESAAFGVVTIVNKGGKVAATSLLKEGVGCVGVDLDGILSNGDNNLSYWIQLIRTHQTSFKQIGQVGKTLALGWHEEAYCNRLLNMLSMNANMQIM
jgi:glycosyltransferase involved in cell wall biosynthesis